MANATTSMTIRLDKDIKSAEHCKCVREYDKLYLSNVIYYDILRNGEIYRTEQVIRFRE